MLSVEEAVARCMAAALPVRPERVPTETAAGRVLVEDVRAAGPQPPWDN
ncbi:MAG: molybdopterin molybdenumtransferase MoeA, partial [Deltaproteobacteria bacterium]